MANKNILIRYVRYDLTHETQLVIRVNKNGTRGSLYNYCNKLIESKYISGQDTDKAIQKLQEYFGYTENNSYGKA